MAKTGFRQADLPQPSRASSYDIASWILMGMALFLVLRLHLLPALLAGFSVYELVQVLAEALKVVRIHRKQGKLAAVGILAALVVLLLMLAGTGIIAFVRADNLTALLNKMADSLDSWRAALPDSIADQLPTDVDELRQSVVAWLRPHAGQLQHAGAEAGRTLAHILFGMGIGALVSLYDVQPRASLGPPRNGPSRARRSPRRDLPTRGVRPSAYLGCQHSSYGVVFVRRVAIGRRTSTFGQNNARHHVPRRDSSRNWESRFQYDDCGTESERLAISRNCIAVILGCDS